MAELSAGAFASLHLHYLHGDDRATDRLLAGALALVDGMVADFDDLLAKRSSTTKLSRRRTELNGSLAYLTLVKFKNPGWFRSALETHSPLRLIALVDVLRSGVRGWRTFGLGPEDQRRYARRLLDAGLPRWTAERLCGREALR